MRSSSSWSPILLLVLALSARSTPTSPFTKSSSYSPSISLCPENVPFVRPATDGLGQGERDWLKKRQSKVVAGLETYLHTVDILGLDIDDFIAAIKQNASDIPVIGLTLSGGGNRAELSGLGMYQALDGRYAPAVDAKTGGLLQAMTFISAREFMLDVRCGAIDGVNQISVSGGTLGLSGLAVNGFPPLSDLIGNGNLNFTTNTSVFAEVPGKVEQGFPLKSVLASNPWNASSDFNPAHSVADIFGLSSLSNVLKVNGSGVDPLAWTFSGLQLEPSFFEGSSPMPVLVGDNKCQNRTDHI